MLSLLLLLPLAVCNSAFTCSIACEKNDVAACTWLAHELWDRPAAARACVLDDKTCDELAIILLTSRTDDATDAVARLTPRCERGDTTICGLIAASAWRSTPAPFALSTRAASRAYCSAGVPSCSPFRCADWGDMVRLCTAAATGLNEPNLAESAWSRALVACRKDANACVDILATAASRIRGAKTLQQKSQATQAFAEVVNASLPACSKPDDGACRALHFLKLDEVPSVASAVQARLCTVVGGRICTEQDLQKCDRGNGPLASCINAVLALGSDEFRPARGINEKLVDACRGDDAVACFAYGVANVAEATGAFEATADEAFVKACKLKHQGGCRAATTTAAIAKPLTVPKDVVHPNELVSVHVRAKGNGAALGKVYLVEQWVWDEDGDEAVHTRAVIAAEDAPIVHDRLQLAGLNEGADIVVWDTVTGSITRTVALTNVVR